MTSDMSGHRDSQHASLHKRKRGKDPSFFDSSATGCKTRQLIKTNARKERKNRGNVEKQRRNGH